MNLVMYLIEVWNIFISLIHYFCKNHTSQIKCYHAWCLSVWRCWLAIFSVKCKHYRSSSKCTGRSYFQFSQQICIYTHGTWLLLLPKNVWKHYGNAWSSIQIACSQIQSKLLIVLVVFGFFFYIKDIRKDNFTYQSNSRE